MPLLSEFPVAGPSGDGSGDMLAQIYDPTGQRRDIFGAFANRTLSNLTNPQQALSNLGAGVRPNLLINAYFVGGGSQQGGGQLPINQRGQTSYSGTLNIFDRWYSPRADLTVSLQSDGVLLSRATSQNSSFYQKLQNRSQIGVFTFSALVKGVAGNSIALQIGSTYITTPYSGDWQIVQYTKTINSPSDWDASGINGFIALYADYNSASGGTTLIAAAKLEEGDGQTLAYQDESGAWQLLPQQDADYGAQLAQCQRYLVVLRGFGWIGSGVMDSSTQGQFFIPLPVTMRTVPTISGTVRIYNYLNNLEATEISAASISSNGIHGFFKIGSGSTLSSGDAVFLWLNTDEQLIISAEL